MTEAALIAGLIFLYTFQSLFCKLYSSSYPGREELTSSVFTVVSGMTVAVISIAFADFSFNAAWQTVLLGVLNALALSVYNASLIKASSHGPYSVLMVFMIAGGIILPAISARVFFGDGLSWIKLLCISVVLISVYMISKKDGETYENKRAFFLSCILLALGNGAYGSILDAQQRITGSAEKEEVVAITYFLAALFAAVSLLAKEKGRFLHSFKQNKSSLIFLVSCSVVTALAINLLVYILPLIDTTILYTLDNSSVFLISVLCSCFFFREKLSKFNALGCITMCAALVCITLFG